VDNDFKGFIVGAYVTSPSLAYWNESKEVEFMQKIQQELNPIRGLELPFWGDGIHLYDEELFLSLLDRSWEYVITCLPGNMKRLESNIHFGIASDHEKSRIEAVNFYKKASESVKMINDYFGAKKVFSVVIATAPSLNNKDVSSSEASLVTSLKDIIQFDWGGARIVVEHCDSGRIENSEKGFLSIEEEIKAINYMNSEYDADIGLTINWARSAIEFRSENGPNKHIKKALHSNVLSGLMFSGTSDKESEYGIWSDFHMPIAKEEGILNYKKESLLNKKNISSCLIESDYKKLDYMGIKVLAMPIDKVSLERRIGINKDTMFIINNIMNNMRV